MKLNKQISKMYSMMFLNETSDRMLKVFDVYMKQNFPNFRKDKSKIIHKRQPTRRYSIVDPDDFEEFLTPTGFGIDYKMYVIYFPRTNELYVTEDIINEIYKVFDKEGVQYLIDWVNKEFGFEAEYITI